MKYVKVLVPDDFNPETCQIFLHTPVKSVEYPDIPDWKTQQVDVWQPIYENILDHGFLGLLDFMGDDQAVVDAARVSYGAGTRRVSEDRGLIRYLMRMRHSTPFEQIELKFHMKLPIFVARQVVRHRTACINEYSGRYSIMTNDTYMPDVNVLKPQSKSNKQGRAGELSGNNAEACQIQLQHIYQEASQAYRYLLGDTPVPSTSLNTRYDLIKQFAMERIQWLQKNDPLWKPTVVTDQMIDDKIKEIVVANGLAFTDDEFWGENGEGLSRELARIGLTLATYTEWYWKCDLKNTLHFISLRSDPHAQYEVKVYSDAMLEMVRPLAPLCVEAFIDYQMKARNFSAAELAVVRELYKTFEGGPLVEQLMAEKGASKREIKEFLEVLSND